MKKLIARILPKSVLPFARDVYWKLSGKTSSIGSSHDYGEMEVLSCKVGYNKYGAYCVPLSSQHRPAARCVLSDSIYEPETIQFIIDNCGEGDVVHAGTYFGDFLPALSSAIAPGAKVFAFEPNPENFRCAKITVELNGIQNIELQNAGLGELSETLLVKTKDEKGNSLGGASRIVTGGSGDTQGTEAIQILTVDDAVSLERTLTILQLDVEGHEKEALSGALKTIQRCRPIIIVEVLPDSELLDSEWFMTNILSLGYSRSREINGNTVFTV